MKRPYQLLSTGILAGALALVPAVAQTAADRPATSGAATASGSGQTVAGTDMNSPSRNDNNYNRDRDDHGFNFGWLGLVGLAGLLGMRRHSDRVDRMDRVDRYDDTRNINNTGPGGIR